MNWFDIVILIVAAYSIFKGFKTGLVKQLASLGGLLAGAILSGQISYILEPYMSKVSERFAAPLSYLIAFMLIITAFAIVGRMLHEILETVKLGTLNRLAGATLCFSKWMVAISILISLISKSDENKRLISDDFRNKSRTFNSVQAIAPIIVPYLKFEL